MKAIDREWLEREIYRYTERSAWQRYHQQISLHTLLSSTKEKNYARLLSCSERQITLSLLWVCHPFVNLSLDECLEKPSFLDTGRILKKSRLQRAGHCSGEGILWEHSQQHLHRLLDSHHLQSQMEQKRKKALSAVPNDPGARLLTRKAHETWYLGCVCKCIDIRRHLNFFRSKHIATFFGFGDGVL